MMAVSAGGMVRPMLSGGSTAVWPDTHCTVTRSPDWMVNTGGNLASNWPNRTVSGEAARWCWAM